MASVRMSRDLRGQIKSNAMQAFDVTNPEPSFATTDINFIVDAVLQSDAQATLATISQTYDKLPRMRSSWSYNKELTPSFGFVPPIEQRVTKFVFVLNPRNETNGHRTTVDLGRAVRLYSTREAAEFSIDIIDDSVERARVVEILDAFEKRCQDYRTKRNEYHASISSLLDECTTLKQFLQAWPAGESFVPQDKINELHTKVTRIQKARQIKENISFDDTAINQVVLTAKLMGN